MVDRLRRQHQAAQYRLLGLYGLRRHFQLIDAFGAGCFWAC